MLSLSPLSIVLSITFNNQPVGFLVQSLAIIPKLESQSSSNGRIRIVFRFGTKRLLPLKSFPQITARGGRRGAVLKQVRKTGTKNQYLVSIPWKNSQREHFQPTIPQKKKKRKEKRGKKTRVQQGGFVYR